MQFVYLEIQDVQEHTHTHTLIEASTPTKRRSGDFVVLGSFLGFLTYIFFHRMLSMSLQASACLTVFFDARKRNTTVHQHPLFRPTLSTRGKIKMTGRTSRPSTIC